MPLSLNDFNKGTIVPIEKPIYETQEMIIKRFMKKVNVIGYHRLRKPIPIIPDTEIIGNTIYWDKPPQIEGTPDKTTPPHYPNPSRPKVPTDEEYQIYFIKRYTREITLLLQTAGYTIDEITKQIRVATSTGFCTKLDKSLIIKILKNNNAKSLTVDGDIYYMI